MTSHMALPLPFFGVDRENDEVADDLVATFRQTLATGPLLNGADVFAIEELLANDTGRRFATAINSATDGLYFALVAAGIGPGDEVLVPAFSFIASSSCVLRAGATPVFVDATGDGLAPCAMDLDHAATSLTPRTKAIVWVDLFGGMSDPLKVTAFAQANHIMLIEDASQSYGAAYGKRLAGSVGAASVFSFDRNKTLGALGTGGAILTDDPALNAHFRSLRYHGISEDGYQRLGYNSQMSTLSAAVLLTKRPNLSAWVKRRQEIAAKYDETLMMHGVAPLSWDADVFHTRHKYVLKTDRRADLQSHLKHDGIPFKHHYARALPDERIFAGLPYAEVPVARELARQVLSLPIYAQMSKAEVSTITNSLDTFFR